MSLVLHGYHYSVYNRIARLALAEKGVAYDRVEVNPFADIPAEYLALHPFGRVPTLVHDGFVLYETGAITRYVDRTFAGPALQPGDAAGACPHGPVDRHHRFLRLLADGPAGLLPSRLPGRGRPAGRRGGGRARSRRRGQGPGRSRGAGVRAVSCRTRAVACRSSRRRDDRLLHARARRRRAAGQVSAACRLVGQAQPHVRASPRPIRACPHPTMGPIASPMRERICFET